MDHWLSPVSGLFPNLPIAENENPSGKFSQLICFNESFLKQLRYPE